MDTKRQTVSKEGPVVQPPTTRPKRSKKFWALIVAGLVAIAFISSAIAYFLWYNKPNKMLADGIISLANSTGMAGKASINSDDDSKLSSDFNIQYNKEISKGKLDVNFSKDGENYKVNAEFIGKADGTVYFKINDIEKLTGVFTDTLVKKAEEAAVDAEYTDEMREILRTQISTMISPVLELKDKWIVVKKDDFTKLDPTNSSKSSLCLNEIATKLNSKPETFKHVAKAFRKNQFLTVDESVKVDDRNGSKGLRVAVDESKFNKFIADIDGLESAKGIKDCIDQLKSDAQSSNETTDDVEGLSVKNTSKSDFYVNVWVDRFTHRLTDIEYAGKTETTTKFEQEAGIEDITTSTKLQSDIKVTYTDKVSVDLPADSDTVNTDKLAEIIGGLLFLGAGLDDSSDEEI